MTAFARRAFRGGRSVFPLDSMLRVMFSRPDLEVYYALTSGATPPAVGIDNVVDAEGFFRHGPTGEDLVLGFDKRKREFQELSVSSFGLAPAER